MAPSCAISTPSSNKRTFTLIDSNGNGNHFPSHPTKQRTRRENMVDPPMRPIIDPPNSHISEPVVPKVITLKKKLMASDLGPSGARLLLPNTLVRQSRLLEFLTMEEHELVQDKSRGVPVRAFDWCGKEYNLLLKYLECNNACRLINEWSKFLRQNGSVMRIDDKIKIRMFRIPKGEGRTELGMTMELFPVSKAAREEAIEIEQVVSDNREDMQQEERNEEETTNTDDDLEVTDEDLQVAHSLLLLSKSEGYISRERIS